MATAVHSANGVYLLDNPHSTVQFAVRHVGVSTFRASFSAVDARLVLENKTAKLDASATVESISIADPEEFREHVVRGEDFFAAGTHPTLSFRSSGFTLEDDGAVTVSGELVVRGVSGPVTATGRFTAPTEDPFGAIRVGLELEATIDRRVWGMNWQMPLPNGGEALGWDVAVTAHLELTRTA